MPESEIIRLARLRGMKATEVISIVVKKKQADIRKNSKNNPLKKIEKQRRAIKEMDKKRRKTKRKRVKR